MDSPTGIKISAPLSEARHGLSRCRIRIMEQLVLEVTASSFTTLQHSHCLPRCEFYTSSYQFRYIAEASRVCINPHELRLLKHLPPPLESETQICPCRQQHQLRVRRMNELSHLKR